jgi:hypothetical protein
MPMTEGAIGLQIAQRAFSIGPKRQIPGGLGKSPQPNKSAFTPQSCPLHPTLKKDIDCTFPTEPKTTRLFAHQSDDTLTVNDNHTTYLSRITKCPIAPDLKLEWFCTSSCKRDTLRGLSIFAYDFFATLRAVSTLARREHMTRVGTGAPLRPIVSSAVELEVTQKRRPTMI